MSTTYVVTADVLNLRRDPRVSAGNVIARLPARQAVDRLGEHGDWFDVRTVLQGQPLRGFVAARYLARASEQTPLHAVTTVQAVHMPEGHAKSRRDSTSARAYPLAEAGAPRRGSIAGRHVAELNAIVDWLAVETSARYEPKSGTTFCNIYAYDYCTLANAYLPRVWWSGPALLKLAKGEPVEPRYGVSLFEMNANALYDWLQQFGSDFGWSPVFSLDALQSAANVGKVALISAKRKDLNRSGHIAAVVPERPPAAQARRNVAQQVVLPLTSQAGAKNIMRAPPASAWWSSPQHQAFAFWIHD